MCFKCAQTTLFLPVSYFILNYSMIYPWNAAPVQSPFLNCKTHRGRFRDRFSCCVTLQSLSCSPCSRLCCSPLHLLHSHILVAKKGLLWHDMGTRLTWTCPLWSGTRSDNNDTCNNGARVCCWEVVDTSGYFPFLIWAMSRYSAPQVKTHDWFIENPIGEWVGLGLRESEGVHHTFMLQGIYGYTLQIIVYEQKNTLCCIRVSKIFQILNSVMLETAHKLLLVPQQIRKCRFKKNFWRIEKISQSILNLIWKENYKSNLKKKSE